MKYFGWIPNLRGRLSFSTIGSSTLPYPSDSYASKVYQLIIQSRTLNDSAIPRFIRKFLFESHWSPFRKLFILLYQSKIIKSKSFERLLFNSGDFEFVLLQNKAKCLNGHCDDSFCGKIFVISKDLKLVDYRKYFEKLHLLLNRDSSFEQIENHLESSSILNTNFHLDRCGFAEFENVKFKKVEKKELKWTNYSTDSFKAFKLQAVSQLYYFLKDLCHQHQHHDSKTDTLLPLISSKPNRPREDAICMLSEQIFKSLYRVVLKMRRPHTPKDYYSMRGLLSYIGSFRRIVKQRPECKRILSFNDEKSDESLLSSIEAKSNFLMFNDKNRSQFLLNLPSILSITMASMALLFTFSSLTLLYGKLTSANLQKKILVPDSYFEFVKFIIECPIIISIIIIIIFFGFFLLTSDMFKHCKYREDAMRLTYAYGKQTVTSVIVLLIGFIMISHALDILGVIDISGIISLISQLKEIIMKLYNLCYIYI